MRIKRYRGKYPDPTKLLYEKGALVSWPTQIVRSDLTWDEGIDIVYRLKSMSPAKFREYADVLLLAAYTEAERYKEEQYRFARFEVQLNVNQKGRKAGTSPRRSYIAAKNRDSEVMVYGAGALGYTPTHYVTGPSGYPVEEEQKCFLINKVEDILGIPDSTSPGPYVEKQRPYTVIEMVICIRAGIKPIFAELREKQEAKTLEEAAKLDRQKAMEADQKVEQYLEGNDDDDDDDDDDWAEG